MGLKIEIIVHLRKLSIRADTLHVSDGANVASSKVGIHHAPLPSSGEVDAIGYSLTSRQDLAEKGKQQDKGKCRKVHHIKRLVRQVTK